MSVLPVLKEPGSAGSSCVQAPVGWELHTAAATASLLLLS